MAIKRVVNEECQDCGKIIALVEDGYVLWGGHICLEAKIKRPEGLPQPLTRRMPLNSVRFIPSAKKVEDKVFEDWMIKRIHNKKKWECRRVMSLKFDELLEECRPITIEEIDYINGLVADVNIDLDEPLSPEE